MSHHLEHLLFEYPIVAILRGIQPSEILDVAKTLVEQNIRVIEVPLNSPNPFDSIKLLSDNFGGICLCGAGTVVTEQQVSLVHEAGGKLIVSPNADSGVIARTKQLDMTSIPGFNTPTEAYNAIHAGATLLKLFPASDIGTSYLKSISAILPKEISIIATGGITAENLTDWQEAGATAFGTGRNLYSPGISMETLKQNAIKLTNALKNLNSK